MPEPDPVAQERERCLRIVLAKVGQKRGWARKCDRLGLHNGGALAMACAEFGDEIAKLIRNG